MVGTHHEDGGAEGAGKGTCPASTGPEETIPMKTGPEANQAHIEPEEDWLRHTAETISVQHREALPEYQT